MVKVANRVEGKKAPRPHSAQKESAKVTRDMNVSIADGFKDIREMNKKLLNSLKS